MRTALISSLVFAFALAGCASGPPGGHRPPPGGGFGGPKGPGFAPRGPVFISPMGEPFRGSDGGDPTGRWFDGADADHDARVTIAEMQADALRFFATLDTDQDGEIAPEEMERYERDVAPEVRVQDAPRGGRGAGGPPRGGGGPGGGFGGGSATRIPAGSAARAGGSEGAARFGLLDLPQPVIAADANFNRGVSAKEFAAAAAQRLMLLDGNHDGAFGRDELRRPEAGGGRRARE